MLQLNWKAAATVVTGATALAGWLATPSAPAREVTRSSASARRELVTTSLQAEASKLAARLRPASAYAEPHRNPFRFPPAAPARRAAAAVVSAPAAVAVPPPAPVFPFRLTGMATDGSTGTIVRTAVLSGGASGLVLAKVGDVVGGVYRVERIDEDALDLVDVRDNRTIRLTLVR